MSDRLTDEQVAFHAASRRVDAAALAREVQEYRALRPTCPTCHGEPTGSIRECSKGFGGYYDRCPDCDDGKMPLAEWVALLVEDGKRLEDALRIAWTATERSTPFHADDRRWTADVAMPRMREALAAHDAVLKVAGKS